MTYKEFKDKYNGKWIDYDGAYGCQCWDLGEVYFIECLGLPASVLAGCGLVSNMLYPPKRNELDKYFDEVPTNDMRQGDVCIWEYGHIAIFDNWDGSNCWYFSQNPNPCQVMKIVSGGLHAFRLKGSEPTPTPVEYKIGDRISINGVYISSDSDKMLTPAITEGTITRIINGARNPYLLDDGNIGWVNNDCIVGLIGDEYYPAFNNTSIVDGLASIGVDNSFEYRTKIANKNGIRDYIGSYEQNVYLLDLARQGKLKRV